MQIPEDRPYEFKIQNPDCTMEGTGSILNYTRIDFTGGYVDYASCSNEIVYQIVLDRIKEGPDLRPTLYELFKSFTINVLPPERDFPAWTVRIKNIPDNPWKQQDLIETYPKNLADSVEKLLSNC